MPVLTDQEVVDHLGSRDRAIADAAVAEIMRRGERVMPLLLMCRGNTEPFAGRSLFNPRASVALPIPIAGFEIPESERFRVVTVEAAALYLVSAIHRGDLHFAQAPLLFDTSVPLSQRRSENTPDRLARAYEAARSWLAKPGDTGLSSRSRADPIEASQLRWY